MQPSSLTSQETASVACTIILGCAEDNAWERARRSTLREHAVVLRSHDGEATGGLDEAVAALLRTRPIERIVVLGHTGCSARGETASELMQDTAAIAAWYRLAPAARVLTQERTAGRLGEESFRAKLDALVRLANLESCAELHAALRRGAVEVHALVCDGTFGRSELLDGTRFRAIDDAEIARLISRRRRHELEQLAADAPSGVHSVPDPHTTQHGKKKGGHDVHAMERLWIRRSRP
jgi:hypothetical protein